MLNPGVKNHYCLINSYEGGRFVQEVHEDYIVQEETGRIDFGYIATMSEVCRGKGQHFIIN